MAKTKIGDRFAHPTSYPDMIVKVAQSETVPMLSRDLSGLRGLQIF
ncbi:hypothetical protein [Methanosarcina sp.]